MEYTEYQLEDGTSTANSFARAVKEFPVYVYSEWNNSFHASDSYIVATNEATQNRDCLLANNRKELRAAVQSLVDQRVRAAHELFKLSREY